MRKWLLEATLSEMLAVGLKVLKNRLSEYVRMAARGEVILVTDRDRVVAELSPPRLQRADMVADAQLAEIVRQGWLSPPILPRGGVPDRAPVTKLDDLLEDLSTDRAER